MSRKTTVEKSSNIPKRMGIIEQMAPIDLTKVLKKIHDGKWVAFSRDYRKVIDYSEDLVALKKSMDAAKEDVAYMKVPTAEFAYANY